jgi:shikimate kinase / 3-dehydroquinate synthase
MERNGNLILTGFMGTGKTTVGRLAAERLGWDFLDTDTLIEEREGRSIAEIFREPGEAYFRSLEKSLCAALSRRRRIVVATGGGMPLDPDNRKALNSSGIVVRLRCAVSEIVARVGNGSERPLLLSGDLEGRISELMRCREPAYCALPFHVDTTGVSIDEVLQTVLGIATRGMGRFQFLSVNVPGAGGYSLVVGPGALELLGDLVRGRGWTSRIAVVTDGNVAPLFLDRAMSSLERAGFSPFACVIPPGEQSKCPEQLQRLYGAFLDGRLDRRGAVVALGGGVIGDLAGYAAATYMRGVGFIQCPTTLLAMVDSSIGGKTGIDLPQGKNLVGAVKQPALVCTDTTALASLSDVQVRMGMAEVIKHTVIDDPELFKGLLHGGGPLRPDADLVARSAAVKIRVVELDPYESGRREVLNLGHTVGHAVEKCSRYAMGHGDAVSVGLAAAARISERMGLCRQELTADVESILERNGLPIRHAMSPDELATVMASDKKTVEGRVRFVLIKEVGNVEPGWEVDPKILRDVLEEMRITPLPSPGLNR